MSNQNPIDQSPENAVDLTAFDANYAAAEVTTSNQVPDGKYRVSVAKVRLSHSPNGTSLLTWDLRIVAGQFAGRHVFKRMAITDKSLPHIKHDLLLVGLDLGSKFSSLADHLESLAGKTLSVTKRTTKDLHFQNVYFNK
ncbi:MAG: DUF669 domain-containing protein [Thermoguttaceae bacterium]|jgi:hypothetical protein